MKVILFRFESELINLLECDINSDSLVLGDKEKISLKSAHTRGEKYKKVLDELLQIQTKYTPDFFVYHSPMKYLGAIKDEEGFANSVILNLYSYEQDIKLIELTPPIVRGKLSVKNKDFKERYENEKMKILNDYSIAKSDKLLDGFVFLYMLKDKLYSQ